MKKTVLLLAVISAQILAVPAFSQTPAAPVASPAIPATSVYLKEPAGVAVDATGNVFFVDRDDFKVWKIAKDGSMVTVAGTGVQDSTGDGGPGTSAALKWPMGVAVDAAGNVFIADNGASKVRKVDAKGIITTVAGNGTEGSDGDGGPAPSAQLYQPSGVAVDGAGNLWILNGGSGMRKVVGGTITRVEDPTVVKKDNVTKTTYSQPTSAAVDAAGNVYLSDTSFNHRIRKIATDGTITTIAGTGTAGFSGDGGPAASAALKEPRGIALDKAGNLYIADAGNSRIRKITTDGKITTIAGTGKSGFSGDGGPAIKADIYGPDGLAVDAAGNIYFSNSLPDCIRKVAPDGTITTIAGKQ